MLCKPICVSHPPHRLIQHCFSRDLCSKQYTEGGAAEFCRLRGYLSTMKKQGRGVMETIRSLFAGKVIMPALRC